MLLKKMNKFPIVANTSDNVFCLPLMNVVRLIGAAAWSDWPMMSSAVFLLQARMCSSYALLTGGGRKAKTLKVFLYPSMEVFLGGVKMEPNR